MRLETVQQNFNRTFAPVFTTEKRYIDLWGGRARGASHFGTDYFLTLLISPGYFRGCFMRAIFGDIRGSLWADFKDRHAAAVESGLIGENDIHLSDSTMTAVHRPTGNMIISKGFKKSNSKQTAKLKSLAGMTHILIEECEEIDLQDFQKLDDSLRTTRGRIQVLRLFNPPHKNHWLIKTNYNLIPSEVAGWYRAILKRTVANVLSIHSTYRDNIANINETTKDNYRAYGDPASSMYDPDQYYRDVCGLVSEGKKGRIYTNCYPITPEFYDSLPWPEWHGIDFGFSIDPTAVIGVKVHNDKVFVRQKVYRTHLTNEKLADMLKAKGITRYKIVADSAEPKSIETLNIAGIPVLPAAKGADSLLYGIKMLQGMKWFVTEDSKDVWKELEEYSWELDGGKEPTDQPIDKYNHALDAVRYVVTHGNRPTAGKVRSFVPDGGEG